MRIEDYTPADRQNAVGYQPQDYTGIRQPTSALDLATLTLPDGRVLRKNPQGTWAIISDPAGAVGSPTGPPSTPATGGTGGVPSAGGGGGSPASQLPSLNFGELIRDFITKVKANPQQRDAFHDQMMSAIKAKTAEWQAGVKSWVAGHGAGFTDANGNGVPDRMEGGGGGMNAPRPIGQEGQDADGGDMPGGGRYSPGQVGGFRRIQSASAPGLREVGVRRLPGTAGNTGSVPGQAEASGGQLWQRLSGLQQRLDGLRGR